MVVSSRMTCTFMRGCAQRLLAMTHVHILMLFLMAATFHWQQTSLLQDTFYSCVALIIKNRTNRYFIEADIFRTDIDLHMFRKWPFIGNDSSHSTSMPQRVGRVSARWINCSSMSSLANASQCAVELKDESGARANIGTDRRHFHI